MDIKEVGCDVVDWTRLVHDRGQWRDLMKTAMNLRVS